MKDFPKPDNSMAGIEKFWFIPINDIYGIGDIILGEIQNIEFNIGKNWYSGYSVFNTRGFFEDKKENKAGISFGKNFAMFYPGYSQAVINQLEEMKINHFIIAYKDNNGLYKMAGTIDNPLNFSYKLNTGKSGKDSKGIDMKFYADSMTRIFSTTGEILNILPQIYNDWYLPSKNEIQAMYNNLHAYNLGNFSLTDNYWSSSEYNYHSSYAFSFNGNNWNAFLKSNTYYIRACRSFTAMEGQYSLRDNGPAGGLIFYIDGTTYYEAALSDQSSSKYWSNITDQEIGTTGIAIGTGQTNTSAIIAQSGGATDWFLPSKDELDAIYINLHSEGIGDFTSNIYWSSSEFSFSNSWAQAFSNGFQSASSKTNNHYVRAIRFFQASEGIYSLRDIGPTGGYIFYIDGINYWEAAPEDIGLYAWSNISDQEIGTTSQNIGMGYDNTINIISQPGHINSAANECLKYDNSYSHTDSAAKLCHDLSIEN